MEKCIKVFFVGTRVCAFAYVYHANDVVPVGTNEKIQLLRVGFFGWGTGIRTPEMSESESDALPLGDAPIFSTDAIIAEVVRFVKGFLEKN